MQSIHRFVAKHRKKQNKDHPVSQKEWEEYLAKHERWLSSGKFSNLVELMKQVGHRHLDCYAGKLYEECNNYNSRLHGKERYTYEDAPLLPGEDPTAWRPRVQVVHEEVYWCHDPFRVWGYPSKRLFSLRQTLNYRDKLLAQDNPPIQWEDYSTATVTEFWARYPDGMITFG